jgi:hypothetical protein
MSTDGARRISEVLTPEKLAKIITTAIPGLNFISCGLWNESLSDVNADELRNVMERIGDLGYVPDAVNLISRKKGFTGRKSVEYSVTGFKPANDCYLKGNYVIFKAVDRGVMGVRGLIITMPIYNQAEERYQIYIDGMDFQRNKPQAKRARRAR